MRRLLADRHRVPLHPREHLLVTVGALIPRKGQRLVIEALPLLPGCVLALVGDGPDRAKLTDAAFEAEVAERVHFLGVLDHHALPELLSVADAMVLPASSEGLANAWIEALACGTPLVIAETGGAREVMQDASAGRIVARNPAAIAAAVQDLLDNPPPREAVVANAARFSWEANAAALAEYYEGLLAQ
jgi:glycosyltransferase involved in cell wall biosynthesis